MRPRSASATQSTSSKASRRIFKALVLIAVFIAAFSSTGGVGVLVALGLLGLWLFLDVQDSTAPETQ